jgi:hypothetical protein
MAHQITNLRSKLVEEFNQFFNTDEADDVTHLLSQGGYCLEVSFEQGLEKGSVPVAFIFARKFLRTRLELAIARKTHKVLARPTRNEIARDLSNVSKKLLALYETPVFASIDKLLLSTMKANYHEMSNLDNENSETWELNFEVDGVWLMGIYCDHYSSGGFEVGIDDAVTDPKDILDALPPDAVFLNLPEQVWFSKLSPKTQLLIRVGAGLVEKAYLNSDKTGLEDFSPLLLSFWKAVESQLAEHYQKHLSSLIKISETIIKDLRLPSNGNGFRSKVIREFRGLIELATKIQKHKDEYYPSGTLPLYYLLKFFALRNGIESLNFNSYLDSNRISKLPSNESGFDWLKSLGHNRNSFVHEGIIDNEHEFLMLYDGVCRVLKLLVQLDDDDVANTV